MSYVTFQNWSISYILQIPRIVKALRWHDFMPTPNFKPAELILSLKIWYCLARYIALQELFFLMNCVLFNSCITAYTLLIPRKDWSLHLRAWYEYTAAADRSYLTVRQNLSIKYSQWLFRSSPYLFYIEFFEQPYEDSGGKLATLIRAARRRDGGNYT